MSDSVNVTELAEQSVFSGLDRSYLTLLTECSRRRSVSEEEILCRTGDRAKHFYLIHEGSLSTEVPAISGPNLEMQHLEQGEIMGWSWLISPYRWHFQARALEDSELIEFDGEALLARCEQDAQFGYELFKRFSALMSQRLAAARQTLMEEWDPAGFA